MKEKLLNVARKVKRKCFPPKPTLTEIRLKSLAESCHDYIETHGIQAKTKILWPTLFNQDQTRWSHDGLLICALKIRGADIIPTMCDKLQSEECLIFGGVWQGSGEPNFEERRQALCQQCVNADLRLWDILQIRPLRLSSYITDGERKAIWNEVHEIMSKDWESYQKEGYPVGKEAWKGVVNNNLQGEIKLYWREKANAQAAHHIFNILELMHVYKRILAGIQPDRVVGNGGYYYQWGVINHLCQQINLSYYRYYSIGLQPLSWNYNLNTTALIDFSASWSSWIKQPWSSQQVNRVKEDLKCRGMYIDLEENPNKARVQHLKHSLNLDPSKPIFLALTGIIWDANTNCESPAFKNMYQWVFATIDWFAQHPECQLIIRMHPCENIVPTLAANERTTLLREIEQSQMTIPPNVFLIKPEEKVDTYDLMHIADVAATYMSTTGLEFSCLGKPLIAVGEAHYSKKGFTYEPKSQQEYLDLVQGLLNRSISMLDKESVRELAIKYWYFFAFHGSVVTGLCETSQQNLVSIKRGTGGVYSHVKALSAKDILPGVNKHLDYICDTILNNLPFTGDNRWPPHVPEELCKL